MNRRNIRMNNSDNSRSEPCRKRRNENKNVNSNLQHPDPNDQMNKEAHALSSKGQEEQLEAPTKKIKASKQHAHEANAKQEKDDLNISSEAMPSKPVTDESTTDIEMKSPDISNGSLSKSSISSTAAEANKQSGMSNNTSDDRLKINKVKTSKQDKKKKHHSPAETRGYNGLRNQGATCYLNAVLQTLFMTEEFRNAVMELNEENLNKKSVSFALKKLFDKLKSNKGSVSTQAVTTALDIRNVYKQQDAAEYYQKILSMMEPEPAKIFQGTKKHSTTCMHGNHESIDEINSFFSLAVSMDSDQCQINVTESFNAQFEVMLMDGEDQLFCVNCNIKTDMEMKCSIPELPKVLTLHLKRFYLNYNCMTYKKNNRRVQIPLRLSAQEENGVKHYDLYALVHHSGSLSGGHYYADIKSSEDQHWYTFNDSSVDRNPKLDDDRNQQNHFVSDTACLLFFRKSRDDEDQQNHMNISEGKSSQTRTDESTADIPREYLSDDPQHIIINVETHRDSPSTARDDEDQQNQMNNSDLNSDVKSSQTLTDEPTAEMQSNAGDRDVSVSVKLKPLNKVNKTQLHKNNNKTRSACCTQCSTYVISALLVVFLGIIIIIGVIIYNSV